MNAIGIVQFAVSAGLVAVFLEKLIERNERKGKIEKLKELIKSDLEKFLSSAGVIKDFAEICIYDPFRRYDSRGFDLTITNCIFSEGLITEFEKERIFAIREIKIVLENIEVSQAEILKYPTLNSSCGSNTIHDHRSRLKRIIFHCKKAEKHIKAYLTESWEYFYFAKKKYIPPISKIGIIRLP